MIKVLFTITNDVYTDQRVNKMARTLHSMGFSPVIAGIRRRNSPPFNPSYARIRRMPMFFRKGFFFYAEYNIRLFLHLLFARYELLVANDLDTLPAAHLASRIRRKELVYDTHEYFTGTPEVMDRPRVYRVWKFFENRLFPRQNTIITVNRSIARLYEEEYGRPLHVVRNLPPRFTSGGIVTRAGLGVGEQTRIIILQGAGINVERGGEELILAMQPQFGLERTQLWIIGDGNALDGLKSLAAKGGLGEKLRFFPRMPYEQMMEHTALADIGVSLDKDRSINYRYSLPNKVFDYIMAGVPVLASNLPEVARTVTDYGVGRVVEEVAPAAIALALKEMLDDQDKLQRYRHNCLEAAKVLCWEREEDVVRTIYGRFLER